MRLKTSHLFAIAVAVVVGLYFVIGGLFHTGKKAVPKGKAEPAAAVAMASVQVTQAMESQHPYSITVRGRTESARSVVARSETAGIVSATPATEGSYVAKGTVLCRLKVDARSASVDQARAALRSRELTQKASVELAAKGYRSETQVLQDKAQLDGAQASLRQAEIALEQTNIRAPFNGVFDKREAEVGTYLAAGQACGTMIELDPLLIVGDLPETETSQLHVGASAVAKLVSGETLNGRVRYMARDADPQTRTYRMEVTANNPRLTRSGLSATITVASGVGPAHLIPVSSMVLDAAGRQGVRYVQPDNTVAFSPVSVIEEGADGVWVSGLRGSVRVITVGQTYVSEGQKVRIGAAR